ncbi:DEAD-box ATP-dependent RNA helicase 38 [Euphorbia peplus]|nr:DEAD-box ATP-dependent RNA helicase 38 [Euphorbia peplus]
MDTSISIDFALPGEYQKFSGTFCPQLLFGTPSTIKWLLLRNKISMADLKMAIFDDAQQMIDGFEDDSARMVKRINKEEIECQIRLVCTTYDEPVKHFASKILKEDHKVLLKEGVEEQLLNQYKVRCTGVCYQ